MTADVFKVTQVGLDASTSAAASGIRLVLATFKVGSAYGYTPNKSDTALHGSVLYTASITSFSTSSDGSLIVNCTMSVEAGPFDFGEVGIYTDAGVLFALMALPQIEHKYTSLGTNVASTFTFSCYLRLGQAGGVIQINTGGGGGSSGTSNFQYVVQSGQPPALWGSSNGGVDSYVWNPSNFNVATAGAIQNSGAAAYNATSHSFASGNVSIAGSLVVSGNISGSSDASLKTEVVTITDAMATIRKLRGVDFTMIATGEKSTGVIANEVEEFVPRLVGEHNGIKHVAYGNFAGLFIEGFHCVDKTQLQQAKLIQDLTVQVNRLQARLARY